MNTLKIVQYIDMTKRFQTPTAVYVRPALMLDFTQCKMGICYPRFRTAY